ncbi:uncharacterized protein LOC132057782 [Lycium ferocissimum]|uniref:uncharacterized protein LOC132057782 n=1 Tax=Lycium ferocissimum TaxID=112874 RepID=UPI0028154604|nr:uncharacterized protein LOC132057782 [Lycium ferocissimum]
MVQFQFPGEPVLEWKDELPGLLPEREIDFAIDVLFDTKPISIPPYRMTPAKLRDWKEQLKDFLEKGFIRPSSSPSGAPMLFMSMNQNRQNQRIGNQGNRLNNQANESDEENVFTDFIPEEDYAFAIIHPRCGATNIKIDSSLYQLLKLEGYFRNSTENDPQPGDARAWFEKLPQNSITTWAEMVAIILKKWYPPSKKAEIRDKIYEFKQGLGEQLYEAWERFKEYLKKISNHDFPENILMKKFYRGLDPVTQSVANNAANGCFMNKSYRRVTNMLDRLTTHNQAWHSKNADFVPYGSPMIQHMVKDNLDTQQTLAELAINISLLTKKFDETQIKKVNICEDDAEGYQRQNYQGGYQNQNQSRPQQGHGAYNNSRNYNNNYGGANQGSYNNGNNFGNKSPNPYIPLKGQST